MPVALDIVHHRYPVVGRSWSQLEAAMAVAGPTRNGVTFPAYTDWTLTYHYRPTGVPPRVVASDLAVRATAIITLPEWHAAPRADEALQAKWKQFVTDLEQHEHEHAATARTAALQLQRAVEALAPCIDETTLDAHIRALAQSTQIQAHYRDKQIDTEPADQNGQR